MKKIKPFLVINNILLKKHQTNLDKRLKYISKDFTTASRVKKVKKIFRKTVFKSPFYTNRHSYYLKKLKITCLKTKPFLNTSFTNYLSNWTTCWNNLQHQFYSHAIVNLIKQICSYESLFLNKLYIQISNQNIYLLISNLGVFTDHKAELRFNRHLKHFNSDIYKKRLVKYSALFIESFNVKRVYFKIYNTYLPQNIVLLIGERVFQKERSERYFRASLQVIQAIFRGNASAQILGSLVYKYTRRNPKRIKFISFLKRLIDWNFTTIAKKESRIEGVRTEIKGRFNAKSRTKKQILTVGRIRINEGASPVDYKKLVAITKFGSLGIKVWVCPKLYSRNNVTRTQKNKI